ncbi:hypothetical protein ACR720_14445 [Sphingomonas parapaucimobilis]|uniref:hypothetical protein n=1 Tax=Sphingomonas TaxID=13687 RepID=UPI001115538F|nr:hypothetical protein [Sphingomonas sp. Sph1(2015)]
MAKNRCSVSSDPINPVIKPSPVVAFAASPALVAVLTFDKADPGAADLLHRTGCFAPTFLQSQNVVLST